MSNPEPVTTETPNPGGAAPAHRQCHYTKADGRRCRDWAIRGQEHCARHQRFLHYSAMCPIEVPLLEDEDSVILLLSETLRALAGGMIPVSNGRALLAGCRLAHSMHCSGIETAKFRLRLRRLNIPENEIFEPPVSPEPDPAPGALVSEPDTEPDSPSAPPPASGARFRDLKKNWDKEILRAENEITDLYAPRYGETREEFVAARATPFGNLAHEQPALVP
jgi:hypothetical protein